MGVYVDAGVIRIQEYLLRTSGADDRQLRKRRGASLMVADATSPEAFAGLGLEPNSESYHVEGVARLQAVVGEGEDPAGRARTLAEQAAQRLRTALPHAYLRVSWAVADSYAAAYPLLAAARDGRECGERAGSIHVLPALRDDPFSGRCRSCGLAASGDAEQCGDCDMRDGKTAARGTSHQSPRSRALDEVSARAGQPLRPATHLTELAGLPGDHRAKRNHLATVYADGNSVGRLFETVTDRSTARTLSTAIDEAIRHAGAQALHALSAWCDPSVLPAEVTVLAADDALITVPAPLGWVFVRELVETFDQAMAETPVVAHLLAEAEDRGTPLVRPSLTAGVVFSHVKSPIERAIQAADAAMRHAKRAHPGSAAIGWEDLTSPAAAPASSCSLDWFRARETVLTLLAGLPGNRSEQWARDLADARSAAVTDEELMRFLNAEFRRLGNTALVEADLTVKELGQMLSITRWWAPPRRRDELLERKPA